MSKDFLKKFYAGILSLIVLFCLMPAISWGVTEPSISDAGLGGAGKMLNKAAVNAKVIANEKALAEQPEVIVGRIIQGALIISGTIFGLLVIYGGYYWLQARGNEEYVKKAKDILETAIIGLVIIFGAYAFTTFIVSRVIEAAKFGG